MAAPLLTRQTVMLLEVESTYGTDPTPTVGSDELQTTVPSLDLDATVLDREIVSGSLSPSQPIIGRKLVNGSFSTELKSQNEILDGVDTNPLEIDDLLRMGGLDPTYTVETSPPASNDGYATYAPAANYTSATIYCYIGDQVLHKITGAYANLVFDFVAGNYPMINVDFQGIYNGPTDAAAGSLTFPDDLPQQIESLSLALGAVTGLVCRNFSINMNSQIVQRDDVNSANGFKGLRVASRRPTVSFRFEKELIATWDAYAALDAGTTYSTTFTVGATAGAKILVTIPVLTLTKITESEDAGIAMIDVEALCAKNSADGNDEITMKFF